MTRSKTNGILKMASSLRLTAGAGNIFIHINI
jgi:hypothetical protein